VPAGSIVATPMLTVWRRLHLQVHSMGVISGNHAAGTIQGVAQDAGRSAVGVTERLFPDRFQNGRLVVNGMSFPILGNSARAIAVEDPAGLLTTAVIGASFVAYDDDNLTGSGLLHGDEGSDVPAPNMELLADSDLPNENVLAPAYIRPRYDLAGDGGLPFELNVDDSGDLFTDSMAYMIADYWGVPVIGAYQLAENKSNDPDEDRGTILGQAFKGVGSVLFLETIRDVGETLLDSGATTTAHELGHVLGAKHGQGGLMARDKEGRFITQVAFSARSIYSIRHRRLTP
jgi:hypothetical protein